MENLKKSSVSVACICFLIILTVVSAAAPRHKPLWVSHKRTVTSQGRYYGISLVNNNSVLAEEVHSLESKTMASLPIVINTWAFTVAAEKAWEILSANGAALDAVEKGCTMCEDMQCDGTVGYGGSPDENGETTLDAMIMDGETHNVGAVACLRRIKPAIAVARKIMEHTQHTILAGDLATEFAIKMGFKEEDLSTSKSRQMNEDWKNNKCQPNFWKNVVPDPRQVCGPYVPVPRAQDGSPEVQPPPRKVDRYDHDTVSMIAIDSAGRIASGTSSNGARNKIPGRVGDAPIVGAGSYADRDVGGAACTGDGDIMMRFLPSLVAVEEMRRGETPKKAAETAILRIVQYYPNFSGAIVALRKDGEYSASCHNIEGGFPFSIRNEATGQVVVQRVPCI